MPRAKAPRVLLRIADTGKFRENYLQDLSQGGIFIRTEKPLAVGTTLDLDLLPPGWDKPLSLRGRVARIVNDLASIERKSAGMGLTFEGLEPDVDAKLRALIIEHGGEARAQAPSPVRPQEPSAPDERLRAQLAEREQELQLASAAEQRSAARLGELQRERDELAQRTMQLSDELDRRVAQGAAAPASPDEDALAQVHRESTELRIRLAEADGRSAALELELRAFEQDDAQSRQLAEQLALQKNRVEKQRRTEADAAAAEHARLVAEKDALQLRLDEVEQGSRHRSDELTSQLAAAQTARSEGEGLLAASRQQLLQLELQLAGLQRALTDATAATERAQAGHADASTLRTALDDERLRAEGLDRRLTDMTERHERSAAKERELRRLVALLSSGKGEDELVMIDPPAEEGPPSLAQLVAELPEDEPAHAELELELDVDVTATPGPKRSAPAASAAAEPPTDAADVEAFHNLLAAGVRLRRTTRFHSFVPATPQDVRVAAWLEESSTLAELLTHAAGRVSEEKLVHAVHAFFARGFLELGEG